MRFRGVHWCGSRSSTPRPLEELAADADDGFTDEENAEFDAALAREVKAMEESASEEGAESSGEDSVGFEEALPCDAESGGDDEFLDGVEEQDAEDPLEPAAEEETEKETAKEPVKEPDPKQERPSWADMSLETSASDEEPAPSRPPAKSVEAEWAPAPRPPEQSSGSQKRNRRRRGRRGGAKEKERRSLAVAGSAGWAGPPAKA